MAHIPTGLVSHSRKVCNFYKRVIRHIESINHELDEIRYQAVLMRSQFDKNKDIKDFRVAKKLLCNGEEELFLKQHWQYKKFPESPGGVAYQREHPLPDSLLDYWDPIEKAKYPKYFALREKRKLEYEEFYKKEYERKTS
ncbi:NADH dehydrogenase [ubiquinone] 1 beta subcomplex subunit 9 [Phymastichus coffea]|uniref:NADH dehydrogenase [ubiquinone] 1 beta subcomplex subunit 9 n=1 Tax=Phymastichus coffea TaxID=108790 RepID=UPI00273B088E|nr:NADH dehydrogenase [ubiquinone] 1 beta subcomplex subunit 9 [Phymastichus coffea]